MLTRPFTATGSITAIAPLNQPKENDIRRTIQSENHIDLADIYQDDVNMAVWQRSLSPQLKQAVRTLLVDRPSFKAAMALSPEEAKAALDQELGVCENNPETHHLSLLSENIAELVDMFCCLFGLEEAGLRLTSLDKAMCPRFHVDKLQCRLVTTYQGIATEWLPNDLVDRTELGNPNADKLYDNKNQIQRINCGDVALLKGERWEGNEETGLVHRSPQPNADEPRLLLTLDFIH